MGFLDRFRLEWGVHPDDRKRPAADAPPRVMPMPQKLYVPLLQHIGAPVRPVVAVGDRVLKGQLIAEAQGAVSANLHAPTSGTVAAIGEIVAPHPSGLAIQAITVDADGDDRWAELEPCSDPFALDPEEIGRRVAQAGIVGLGGAVFPSSVKIAGGIRAQVGVLVINGSECEPYLSCDDRLMRDRAAGIIDGIRIMMHTTGAREARVGIEDNKPEAIAAMTAVAESFAEIQVRAVPARYPMGFDRHLILALTGIEVPAGSRAVDMRLLVHNVGTAKAVSDAVRHGRPLISRLMTLNGGCVRDSGNIEVPIGALVEEVIAFCGGFAEPPARLVLGGPMMGLQLRSARVPVIKGTSGILALTADEVAEREPGPCIRCSSCVRACPVGLLPLEMSRHIGAGNLAGAIRYGLKDCIACGCCAYVCPSRIPLVQCFNHAKGELAAQERAKQLQEKTKRLAQARALRLEREAKEKAEAAARRKAERAAAKAREAVQRGAGAAA